MEQETYVISWNANDSQEIKNVTMIKDQGTFYEITYVTHSGYYRFKNYHHIFVSKSAINSILPKSVFDAKTSKWKVQAKA